MVGLLAFRIENAIGIHHVVHHVALGNLLGAELLRGREVLAVVVAQMVVANYRPSRTYKI